MISPKHEKSIPYSVIEISKRIGIQRCTKVGMMPLCGTVISEVQALTLLGADVFPIGDGGINGGEGSVTLYVYTHFSSNYTGHTGAAHPPAYSASADTYFSSLSPRYNTCSSLLPYL